MYKLLLLLICVSEIFCAPSLGGCSLESEQQEAASNENLNRMSRQVQTQSQQQSQQVTITEDDSDSSKSQDLLLRLQMLLSLLQTQPLSMPGNQGGNQIPQQGEFIIKLPFPLNPNCYASHFLKNPELIILFQNIIKICGGDPSLLLLILNQQAVSQANGGGLLGGLGSILGGGGGLLGGLGGLLGVGPLQQGGGLLGGLGGILGGQPGGLLGGLSGLLGVGGKGNGLLGGLGGILGGQPGGLLGGLGGLLGTSSKSSGLLGGAVGGKGSGLLGGGLVGGLLGGEQGGLVGGLLGGDNGGLVGGILGGGKGSSGGLLNGVLSGNSNSGQGGILSNNNVLGGENSLATNLVGGLTNGIAGGVLNNVVGGAVSGVVDGAVGGVVGNLGDTLDGLPVVDSILSRRHTSDEQLNDNENEALMNDDDSIEMDMAQQPSRSNFNDKTSQQRIATNMLFPVSSYNNQQIEKQNQESETSNVNDHAQLLGKLFELYQTIKHNSIHKSDENYCPSDLTTSSSNCQEYCNCLSNFKQFSDKQKSKRKHRRRKYKIVETNNRDFADMPETQIQMTNTANECEHKLPEMNNYHRSFYNTMRPPVENVPNTNKFLLNDEY